MVIMSLYTVVLDFLPFFYSAMKVGKSGRPNFSFFFKSVFGTAPGKSGQLTGLQFITQ